MRIVSATTSAMCPDQALRELQTGLQADASARVQPSFVALHGIPQLFDTPLQGQGLTGFAANALHGGTSCKTVLGRGQAANDNLPTAGGFAIFDPAGSYGTASGELGEDPAQSAAALAEQALQRAGRPGEAPDLILLTMAPGSEPAVMRGLRRVVGQGTPIVGGSSAGAGPHGDGPGMQFSAGGVHRKGLVVSVLFPSVRTGFGYQSGFAPTGPNGIVTAAEGRRLIEIDQRPAARVYSDWTDGRITAPTPDEPAKCLLEDSSLMPLGRVKSHLNNVPFHLLLLPSVADAQGSLHLLADIAVGERLWQMQGSADNLIASAGRAMRHAAAGLGQIRGGLVICCAGSAIALGNRLPEFAGQIETALGGAPYLMLFSFGEQGTLPDGRHEHGNLMFSCAAFGSEG